jgi:hypothetical protein
MKKWIRIIAVLIFIAHWSCKLSAQLQKPRPDIVIPEVSKSILASGTAYFAAYEICFQKTNLSQNKCRAIGVGASILTGIVLSIFEQNKKNSAAYNVYGSMVASIGMTVSIGLDNKRDKKRKLVEL